jgi:hypothetical protein
MSSPHLQSNSIFKPIGKLVTQHIALCAWQWFAADRLPHSGNRAPKSSINDAKSDIIYFYPFRLRCLLPQLLLLWLSSSYDALTSHQWQHYT